MSGLTLAFSFLCNYFTKLVCFSLFLMGNVYVLYIFANKQYSRNRSSIDETMTAIKRWIYENMTLADASMNLLRKLPKLPGSFSLEKSSFFSE